MHICRKLWVIWKKKGYCSFSRFCSFLMRTVRFFFSLPRPRLKCFHAVLSYRRSPSSPPRLARLIRKRRCGDGGAERYTRCRLLLFFPRVFTPDRTPRKRIVPLVTVYIAAFERRIYIIWSIQCAYIYMVIRYTVYRAIHQNAHPFFSSIICRLFKVRIFKIVKYLLLYYCFLPTSRGQYVENKFWRVSHFVSLYFKENIK